MVKNHLQRWLRQILNPTRQERKPERRSFRPRLEPLEDRDLLAVFLVTSAANGEAGGGDGTLRAAILASNASPGPNTIDFDLEPGGAKTIFLTSPLPTLANTVTIDGTSQPGWTSAPLITLDGSNLLENNSFNGLTTTTNGCKIKGLVLQNFGNDAIGLYSNNNVVSGNLLTKNENGVEIANAASGNVIGGTTVRGGNTVYGNRIGVLITEFSTGNIVQGNYAGLNPTALQAVPGNTQYGVAIEDGASKNTIGGTAAGAGNVISGNTTSGVYLDSTADNNLIQGNKIGTNPLGNGALPNVYGVFILGSNNTVGGTATGAGNLISGNSGVGVDLAGGSYSLVQGNLIGTDISGTDPVGNGTGVEDGGANDTIGGPTAGAGNVISGNQNDGVLIASDFGYNAVVQGNNIGVDINGNQALANGGNGVDIEDSSNLVGGPFGGAGNIIAFNHLDGVLVSGSVGNTIIANSIFANGLGIGLTNANNGIAAPTLISATFHATTKTMTIVGTIPNTAKATNYTLEVFANTVSDSHLLPPQGAVQLDRGGVTSKVGATGKSTFTVTISITTSAFSSATPVITATVTDPLFDTSQFSNGVHDPVAPAKKTSLALSHRRS